jgi:8-oxo-dGTP diphosphatase
MVGGAVIESAVIAPEALPAELSPIEGVLLVQNRRHGGAVDWTPPGGVIDRGESVLEGLTREVHEETGLRVIAWSEPLYEIDALAPDLGWRLRVVVHRAEVVAGSLRTGADPDGIVLSADVVPPEQCAERLDAAHRWVREPLLDWMSLRWSSPRRYCYLAEGTDPWHLDISRRLDEEDAPEGGED